MRKIFAGALVVLLLAQALPVLATNFPSKSPAEIRQLKKEAVAGDVSAMLSLGDAYHYGRAVNFTSDPAWAAYWYGRAASQGNVEAQTRLGDIYSDPEDRLYNEPTALAWYKNAAEKGYLPAQYSLALLYENAKTIVPDYSQAYTWYVKAAEQGDEQAYETLDGLYIYGASVRSYAEVFDRLTIEAEAGNAEAQWRLGKSYMRGDARQDISKAMRWLEISADQGSAKGLYYFGAELMTGNNPPQNLKRGMQIEKRAADLGYVPAQLYWAHNYLGNDQIPDVAVEKMIFDWWLAAAEKDYSEAQESLSYYYVEGKFVTQDKAEAWKWHLLPFRSPWRQLFWEKDHFPGAPVPSLSDAEKAEGRRRAEAWLVAHPGPYWPRPQ
ncbi:tetratricopeptide repeat protein [Asticcacaulis sp.]|uniref:tetratricopeptide repeat protein n=1 Tax=Asticcacaulis sp. TaxID=1872648 RepID=UPI002C33B57F|nr:tetratricopeptide repeat protein [Asticcacaulis sp.]HTM80293.1 tetratricopeptide repeat protein [Asticcacaulis sp.]